MSNLKFDYPESLTFIYDYAISVVSQVIVEGVKKKGTPPRLDIWEGFIGCVAKLAIGGFNYFWAQLKIELQERTQNTTTSGEPSIGGFSIDNQLTFGIGLPIWK
jgi:hypothetical protein